MLVHAAAVSTSKGAILVLGHSGAGKSTFCRLVAESYHTLADDVCSLGFCQDGGWGVTDARRDERDKPAPVRLYAILRVFQSRTSRLVGISDREACRHLMDAVFEVESQRNASVNCKREWFAQAALVSRRCRDWRLMFSLDAQVIPLIEEELGSATIAP